MHEVRIYGEIKMKLKTFVDGLAGLTLAVGGATMFFIWVSATHYITVTAGYVEIGRAMFLTGGAYTLLFFVHSLMKVILAKKVKE